MPSQWPSGSERGALLCAGAAGALGASAALSLAWWCSAERAAPAADDATPPANSTRPQGAAGGALTTDPEAFERLLKVAAQHGLDVKGGKVRRTSSRFCLGVEHGDYNGTELFGVGTDRFIWMAYKPNGTKTVRIFSDNFQKEGVVSFECGKVPPPSHSDSWARFPHGVDYVLNKEGFTVSTGFDAVLFGNIPGGGMSRSASLCINLILTAIELNGLKLARDFQVVELAQKVENDYIGSPCGQLDQIMIYYAKAGMGTYFDPKTQAIDHVPLGAGAPDFSIVALDTGTDRPGLDKSTYKIRRQECDEFAALLDAKGYGVSTLGGVKDQALLQRILKDFGESHPGHCDRLRYIYAAQQRFFGMMDSWKAGDIANVGAIFRADGHGLRDEYSISGPELESMCDIVRSVPGVLGERMLGGGDKGASGALCMSSAADAVKIAVDTAYPRSRPEMKDKYAVHVVKVCDGVKVFAGAI